MKRHEFVCKACNHSGIVETIGVILSGPRCPKCKKTMKEITVEQKPLRLVK